MPSVHFAWSMRSASLLLLAHTADGFAVPAPVVSFTCGGLAGALGAIVVYPLDTMKSLLQTKEGAARYHNGVQ